MPTISTLQPTYRPALQPTAPGSPAKGGATPGSAPSSPSKPSAGAPEATRSGASLIGKAPKQHQPKPQQAPTTPSTYDPSNNAWHRGLEGSTPKLDPPKGSSDATSTSSKDSKKSKESKPKPQTTVTATEADAPEKSATIDVKVSKDVPKDAPIPHVDAVAYDDDVLDDQAVASQVTVTGQDGTVAQSETDKDNTFFDLTDPEVENEVVVDGWKYTYQVQFDGYDIESVELIDAEKVD